MTMKRTSPRPLFTVFVLIIVAIVVSCHQLAIRTGFVAFPTYLHNSGLPVIDVTLLRLAAEQLGKEEERAEVERLLHRINIPADRNGGQRSFLSSDSPQFYRMWQEFQVHLNDWWRKKRFESGILSELVQLVKVPIIEAQNGGGGSERIRYSSCAVVGNSGILLNREHGALIDGHEAVIRLNNARIAGFERNVGSKTSISFVNSNILHLCARRSDWYSSCNCNPYSENVPIVMYICQPIHLLDYTICRNNTRSLIVTDPRFDELCARVVKYYSLERFVEKTKWKSNWVEEWGAAHEGRMFHYSSGLQAVMLAVGICDRVSLFGFGKSINSKHHYHTNQVSELHLHDYEAEYRIYQDLVERPHLIPFISHDQKFNFPPLVIYK